MTTTPETPQPLREITITARDIPPHTSLWRWATFLLRKCGGDKPLDVSFEDLVGLALRSTTATPSQGDGEPDYEDSGAWFQELKRQYRNSKPG